jgi:ubiquinone/menaquinone biosynthesis C-methylase UbiE
MPNPFKIPTGYNHIMPQDWWDTAEENKILSDTTHDKFWEYIEIPNLTTDTDFMDLGCGIGRIASSVYNKVKTYLGVDFSEGMIVKARELHKDKSNVNFVINNGRDISVVKSKSIDVVYSHLVFQHIEQDVMYSYINEVYRILRPNGIFILESVPVFGKYVNGLTKEELLTMCSKFKVISIESVTNDHYYNIYLKKK